MCPAAHAETCFHTWLFFPSYQSTSSEAGSCYSHFRTCPFLNLLLCPVLSNLCHLENHLLTGFFPPVLLFPHLLFCSGGLSKMGSSQISSAPALKSSNTWDKAKALQYITRYDIPQASHLLYFFLLLSLTLQPSSSESPAASDPHWSTLPRDLDGWFHHVISTQSFAKAIPTNSPDKLSTTSSLRMPSPPTARLGAVCCVSCQHSLC